jgi:RNA polymerase sigma factor (sigma-70 family)
MGNSEDKERFASVVIPYLADALALARWLTKSRTDAEDVVQEACIRAFRSLGGFAGGSPRAWVLAIVRNTAYSWLEKNRNKMIAAFDDLDDDERAQVERGGSAAELDKTTPESQLIAKVDAVQLETAISALPALFREVLVLRDIQGLEYREIADVTGAPIGTVMSRLRRARQRVIKTIRAEGP